MSKKIFHYKLNNLHGKALYFLMNDFYWTTENSDFKNYILMVIKKATNCALENNHRQCKL